MSEAARRQAHAEVLSLDEVPARFRRILSAVPERNEDFLKWELDPRGLVTITHAKNLKGWERWLMKRLGGSSLLKRKLDEPGSDIWVLCDGRHSVASICAELDKKYKERIEPVLTRVVQFLEMLLARNLIYMKPVSELDDGDLKRNRARKRAPRQKKGGKK